MLELQMVIAGRKLGAGDWFDVINPATEQVIGRAPDGNADHVEQAAAAASAAAADWGRMPDEDRKALLHKAADAVAAHAEELARTLTLEQGKPLNGLGSRFELGAVDAWARVTTDLDLPVEVLKDDAEGRIERHRKPIGVVGSITPWNWPLMILCWHVFPALRAGNTVVARPSTNTPLAALRMIELMAAELPPGVLNSVSGRSGQARRLTGHPAIGKLIFTGSTQTGQQVMASAGQSLQRLTLELGGNDAGIVLPDSDPAEIAEKLFWGAFINGGQTCAALKRLYVHDQIYDPICEALAELAGSVVMGDGLDEATAIGPLQNAEQRDIVEAMLSEARATGARVLTGGLRPNRPGFFLAPTILADATKGMRIVDEEQFGPALPIIRFSDLDQVIAEANDNPNGLGGSVWTRDRDLARSIAQRMECGTVWWNQHGAVHPIAPFGGVKTSGIGAQFGTEGLMECTTGQTIFL